MGSTCDELHGPYDGIPIPRAHAACYVAVPEIELVGLCDTWPDQREAARRKWGIDAVYADYRRMLEATKPDIVSVCTTAKPRAEIMLAIADGGYGVKAIWAEKPITFSLEEADRVIHACEKAGITLAVNCSRRWDDKYNQALRMVDDGLIGDVLHVVALAQCGLSHNGSHLLTTLTMFTGARAAWVMGEVEGPSVVGVRHGGDREKMFEAADAAASSDADFAGTGYVGFPNGVRGYFRGISNGPNEWGVRYHGYARNATDSARRLDDRALDQRVVAARHDARGPGAPFLSPTEHAALRGDQYRLQLAGLHGRQSRAQMQRR